MNVYNWEWACLRGMNTVLHHEFFLTHTGPYAVLTKDTMPQTYKRKRSWSRAVFSNLQRKGLEKRFEIQKYVTKPDRKQLAAMLGLTDAQVCHHINSRQARIKYPLILHFFNGCERPSSTKDIQCNCDRGSDSTHPSMSVCEPANFTKKIAKWWDQGKWKSIIQNYSKRKRGHREIVFHHVGHLSYCEANGPLKRGQICRPRLIELNSRAFSVKAGTFPWHNNSSRTSRHYSIAVICFGTTQYTQTGKCWGG